MAWSIKPTDYAAKKREAALALQEKKERSEAIEAESRAQYAQARKEQADKAAATATVDKAAADRAAYKARRVRENAAIKAAEQAKADKAAADRAAYKARRVRESAVDKATKKAAADKAAHIAYQQKAMAAAARSRDQAARAKAARATAESAKKAKDVKEAYATARSQKVIADKAADDAQLRVAITKARAAQKVDTLPSTGDALLLLQLKKSHDNWHPQDTTAQKDQAYKELSNRYSDATRQLADVDKRINSALIAQAKASAGRGGPAQKFNRMQHQAAKAIMLGGMSENQSRVLGAAAIGLGILAIIGRID